MNHDVSIYTPPYLFKGAAPADHFGDRQEVDVRQTPSASPSTGQPIAKAELIRPAAVTHSSDPNQRFVDLPLTVDGNNIDLNVTSNPNLAPPGWYMLFAVDANGVPSVASGSTSAARPHWPRTLPPLTSTTSRPTRRARRRRRRRSATRPR